MQSDATNQPFDNIEFDYTYSAGGSITVTFEKGFVRYRWLSGPFQGVEERDLEYQSKRIGEVAFLVNGHDKVNFNFVTLLIDLPNKLVHSAALLYYRTPNEVMSFDTAVVSGIRRLARYLVARHWWRVRSLPLRAESDASTRGQPQQPICPGARRAKLGSRLALSSTWMRSCQNMERP